MTDSAPMRPSRDTVGDRMRTHGQSQSETYSCWTNMRNRCRNPKVPAFAVYGAIGITVCARWHSFANFLADMGERPSPEHSIDRWPNRNGNYEPGNCRWATRQEQNRNRKTTRPVMRSDGLKFPSMIDAAEQTGCCRRCIRDVCIGRQKTHLGYTWTFLDE